MRLTVRTGTGYAPRSGSAGLAGFERGTALKATTGVRAMWIRSLLVALCLLPLACSRSADVPGPATDVVRTSGDRSERISTVIPADAPAAPEDPMQSTQWPPAKLEAGQASISCEYDFAEHGDGRRLRSLEFFPMVDAMNACQDTGVVRLRYRGKVRAGFSDLVQRVAAMADRMEIRERILDIDSSGGHVEEAIKAGDVIGGSHWQVWVRDGSQCHSACVLVLAAGDTRAIDGKVGIHRLMRDRSSARSRAELAAELRDINVQVRDYLERNGVAMAVADLMMTVPNRDLRLLTADELGQYGLSGTNAVQDDLNRIIVMRKCGAEFSQRRDAFGRAFDSECMQPGIDSTECGLQLRERFGFPDASCPGESPMSAEESNLRRRPVADGDDAVAAS